MKDEKSASPLLSSFKDAENERSQDDRRPLIGLRFNRHVVLLFLAYSVAACLYTGLFFQASKWWDSGKSACTLERDVFPSLANANELSYQHRVISVNLHDNNFAGLPRPELDAAWHEFFEKNHIRVSKADLDFHNITSLPLADGSGYAGQLGVFHELHCLKKIRHYIYRSYYLSNESAASLTEWETHIHHCIEMLRESIICRGDTTLSSFVWSAGDASHLTVEAKGRHQCVDWERLRKWNDARTIDAFGEGVLGKS